MIAVRKKYGMWQFQFDLIFFILKMFGFKRKAVSFKYFIFIHSQYDNDESLLAHEEYHCRRMKDEGFIKYVWKYWRDIEFRYVEELTAHAIEYGIGGNISHTSKSFYDSFKDTGLLINRRHARQLIMYEEDKISRISGDYL